MRVTDFYELKEEIGRRVYDNDFMCNTNIQ